MDTPTFLRMRSKRVLIIERGLGVSMCSSDASLRVRRSRSQVAKVAVLLGRLKMFDLYDLRCVVLIAPVCKLYLFRDGVQCCGRLRVCVAVP